MTFCLVPLYSRLRPSAPPVLALKLTLYLQLHSKSVSKLRDVKRITTHPFSPKRECKREHISPAITSCTLFLFVFIVHCFLSSMSLNKIRVCISICEKIPYQLQCAIFKKALFYFHCVCHMYHEFIFLDIAI